MSFCLLQAGTVTLGWVADDRFVAGYGLAQAVPGPLFTFAAYLGTVLTPPRPGGWAGAALCLGAIFLPAGLLVVEVLPFWENLRRWPAAQAALRGANAAVVGLLLAALYQPVWTTAVHATADFVVALFAYGALVFWRLPPWLVVGLGAARANCSYDEQSRSTGRILTKDRLGAYLGSRLGLNELLGRPALLPTVAIWSVAPRIKERC